MSALAVCLPGIETICEDELHGFGVTKTHAFRGGVNFTATQRQLYTANLWLRTATRVLVRAARFDAHNWDELAAGIDGIAWSDYLRSGAPLRLRVSSQGSRLYHTDAIAERVATQLGGPEAADDSPSNQLLVIRVSHNQVTVSIDSSGDALHRRGYRQEIAKAPLRESLAAALLIVTGWSGSMPLVDPMCGSGTIAIEAARAARGLAPGSDRSFAFQRWPSFAPGTWGSVTADVSALASDRPLDVPIVATDRDAGAVAAARNNAERAGVAGDITFSEASISDLSFSSSSGGNSEPGALVTNPPYGRRIQGGDLRNLYSRLGQVAAAELPGWRVGLLTPEPAMAAHTKMKLSERFRSKAGAHTVHALTGVVSRAVPH